MAKSYERKEVIKADDIRFRFLEDKSKDVSVPVRALEPGMGWQAGFHFLMSGRCPYCGMKMSSVTCDSYGLSWSCLNGCNP